MTAETESLIRFLDGANLVAEGAPRPDSLEDAEDVLASLHPFLATAEGLHDQLAECFGLIDQRGRCADCGRLVVRVHKPRGCAFAAPGWIADHVMSVPYLGKAIWWIDRRLRNAEAPTRPVEQTRVRATDQEKDT